MIPTDPEDLSALAGEYVLGTLDEAAKREVETARALNADLGRTIAFWEEKLAPLAALAPAAEPPAGTWVAIAARLAPPPQIAPKTPWWEQPAPWRWATASLAAIAAALAIYIAQPGVSPVRPLVAVLHGPSQTEARWVATIDRDGLRLHAVANATPPSRHVYELWAIARRSARPEPLGLVTTDGRLQLALLPRSVGAGATLAISVEPPGGSPTGQPTGPVVFVGAVQTM
jgi:anti-sigma-K factor RskA